jgi:hypothetical protein
VTDHFHREQARGNGRQSQKRVGQESRWSLISIPNETNMEIGETPVLRENFTHSAWNSRAVDSLPGNTLSHSSKIKKRVRSNARFAVGASHAKYESQVAELKSLGGNMNEDDESEATARWGSVREFQIDPITVILPAALPDFLPHARETGSILPQRRWLFRSINPTCVRRFSHAISPGPAGPVHPTCCLNTDGPVWPRQLSQGKPPLRTHRRKT